MADLGDDMNRACIRGTVTSPGAPAVNQAGTSVLQMRVETIQRWWRDGAERRASEFHKIVVYEPSLIAIARDLRAGDRVYVEGAIQTRRYSFGTPPREGVTTHIVLNAGATLQRLEARAPTLPLEPPTEEPE